MRKLIIILACCTLGVAGCGGGGGTQASLSGGGGPTGGTPAGPAANVATITVDAGPLPQTFPQFNVPYVSVTICQPGSTTNCQTIDHISVDTGSSGLRIIYTTATASILNALPSLLVNSSGTPNASGNPVAECLQFGDGYSWGSVKLADLTISGEQASGLSVQIIGDPNFPTVPNVCSSMGGLNLSHMQEDTVATFGANGIIGVGNFISDCFDSSYCADVVVQPGNSYYTCTSNNTVCNQAPVAAPQQVSNPVAFFGADNNGVIVELPLVPASGLATVTGSLVFGIGTQSNNALGSAKVYLIDPDPASQTYDSITTVFKNTTYNTSFIDSGSNALYFGNANTATVCPAPLDFLFCPTSTLNLSATNSSYNGNASGPVIFSVANADALSANNTAFSNLAGPGIDNTSFDSSFDWGLPFFFGRFVFTAIEGQNTPGGAGPYYAY